MNKNVSGGVFCAFGNHGIAQHNVGSYAREGRHVTNDNAYRLREVSWDLFFLPTTLSYLKTWFFWRERDYSSSSPVALSLRQYPFNFTARWLLESAGTLLPRVQGTIRYLFSAKVILNFGFVFNLRANPPTIIKK